METADLLTAVLYSAEEPNAAQKKRFEAFLQKKYGPDCALVWTEDTSLPVGFRLECGGEVFEWNADILLRQLTDEWRRVARSASEQNIIPLLREQTVNWVPACVAEEIGTVLTVGDGVVSVGGLGGVMYGEILLFENGIRGMAQNITADEVRCILFGDDREVSAGSPVRRTQKTAGVPVGEGFLGRVVDALGNPIDGVDAPETAEYRPLERPAPGIVDRQSVNRPLETGILAIDSMFPIGRGQRELIIGDRETGKTAIALDTILNQWDKNVLCVYVAIGQKASSVAQFTETLRRHGALDYTVVVCASAGETASLQYIAPYTGCAIAEYFMDRGRDVLIVYDDLSKHAVAYRTISLLLGRSPGREAFPGDVFYLHSRLLERSACLNSARGGGSITALPIVETQANDVSAYIPTNIISITDGQLYLESGLFFAGQRPAVNVGLSVSRVGGDAQTKAMKKACGTLRLDLAQYREIEVFTQFSSDLDETTRCQLSYGQGLMYLLRQPQYRPYKMHEQVILLLAALNKLMLPIPPENIYAFSRELLAYTEKRAPELIRRLEQEKTLSDSLREGLLTCCRDFAKQYSAT